MVTVTWERVGLAGSATDEPLMEHGGEAGRGMEEHNDSEASATFGVLTKQE